VSGRSRADRVDAHAAARDLERGGLGEPDNAVLAGGVGGGVADADQASDGGGVDDRPGASVEHRPQLMLHAQPHPLRSTSIMRSQSASLSSVTAVLVDTPSIVSVPALLKATSRRP
jgi:hypothetical protein